MRDDAAQGPSVSRREILAGAGAAVAASLSRAADGHAAEPQPGAIAQGTVFEDLTGTGRRINEPGIPGVMVSNGRDVVLTGRDGSWVLPVSNGDSVFVIKPPHWTTPLTDDGVPIFSYLHQPGGTPAVLASPGVAPTGPLPQSIDFPLRRQREPGRFEVLLLADTQPASDIELGYVRDEVIASVLGTGAVFGINHGDIMSDDLSLFPRYLRMLGTTGIAWHHCPGNHDMNLESPDGCSAFETWKRVFGPAHYAFQHADATFILLNNVEYFGKNATPAGSRGYQGRIGERQLRFVENVLRHVPDEHLIVVSMHIPLVSFDNPASAADTTVDRQALLELLASRPHTLSFAGHSHTTEHHYLGLDEGFSRSEPHHHHVLTAASGGWWSGPLDRVGIPISDSRDGSPKGFHVLSIDGNHYTTRFVPLGDPGRAQMRILLRAARGIEEATTPAGCAARILNCPIAAAALPAAELIVNIFDGGPRTTVTYQIDGAGQQPVEMQRSYISDPYIVNAFARDHATMKPWVTPAISSHIWKAPLATGLKPGTYRLSVRSRSEYNEDQAGYMVLEVV